MANSLIIALGFSFIHFTSDHFSLKKISAARFSSFVGGISIAYILFHLLPSLTLHQEEIAELFHLTSMRSFQLLISLVILGSGLFYLLEKKLQTVKLATGLKGAPASDNIFWVHIASYSLYNFLTGMILASQNFTTNLTAIFYLIVIGIHFVTNDWVLRSHFKKEYDLYGKAIFCTAILAGYTLASFLTINYALIGLLEAFVTGSIILNAVQDELPYCRQTGFKPFVVGFISYAILLIVFL